MALPGVALYLRFMLCSQNLTISITSYSIVSAFHGIHRHEYRRENSALVLPSQPDYPNAHSLRRKQIDSSKNLRQKYQSCRTNSLTKTSRPDNDASGLCLCVYWSCDIQEETDGRTDRWKVVIEVLKTCLLIICFSIGSKNSREMRFLHRHSGRTERPIDGQTNRQTDRPSYRDAFLTNASKNHAPK